MALNEMVKQINHHRLDFSADRLTRINGLMNRYVESGKLAGIETCVWHRGETVHRETFGYQNLETKTPLSKDSIYRIYSMTKPIASVALMMLYEKALFNLTDAVGQYIPTFNASTSVSCIETQR